MIEILPWHDPYWKSLIERKTSGQLPHALIIAGPGGIGKNHFADLFVRSTLCRQPLLNGVACGVCRGCQLTGAATHPDVHWIMPLEDGKIIGVDQIRETIQFLSLKSQYGSYKLVVISPADKMNINAANSLLKILEEPPENTLLILITEQPARLPPTIRSRCQKISFTKPPADIALEWVNNKTGGQYDAAVLLELTAGAPLRVLEIVNNDWPRQRLAQFGDLEQIADGQSDPIVIADKWLKFGIKESLYWIYTWLVDMVRIKMTYQPPLIGNPDIYQRLWKMADKQETAQLFGRLDRVTKAIQLSSGQVNTQLLMEEVLLGWVPKRV